MKIRYNYYNRKGEKMEKEIINQEEMGEVQKPKKKKNRVFYWLIVLIGSIFIFIASYNIGFKLGEYVEDDNSGKVIEETSNEPNSNSNEPNSNSNEPNSNSNEQVKNDVISTNDLFAYQIEDKMISIMKVENGVLYGFSNHGVNEELSYDSNKPADYVKVLDNVKRIKVCYFGSDISPTYIAIMNDGTVKEINVQFGEKNKFVVTDDKFLKDYKVDSIISYEGGVSVEGPVRSAKVKLIDGTIKEKEGKYN